MEKQDGAFDALKLENQVCFPLYACAKEVVRQYRPHLEKLELTYTQYIVMMILWEHGGMTEGDLGKIIHLDSGTLAPLLKRLEKQGLLTRSRPESNERKLMIELTQAGMDMEKAAETVPFAMKDCIPLSEDELLALRALLKKAMNRMHACED